MPEERIQKVLAAAGVASRRGSEVLVAAGRVRVNGRVAVIGEQIDPASAQIEVDGIPVGVGAARTYVALHKPAGVTSTTRDPHAEATVLDLIPTALVPDGTRIYPVGRLDLDSEGLLLLTNDGEWADHVLHPRFGVQREYAVALERPLDHEQAAAIRAGIMLEEGLATLAATLRPATAIETRTLVELLHPAPLEDLTWYRAVLAQGWKRQLRRMFAATGAPILRLVRVRIGTVRLDRLPTGRSRLLRAPEIRQLGAVSAGAGRPKPTGPKATGPRTSGPKGAAKASQTVTPKRQSTPKVKGAPGSTGPRRPAPKPALTGDAALAKAQPPPPAGTRPGRRRTKAAPGPSAPFRHGGRAKGKTHD
ncbi:MAG: pseudouridine synthase [Chloroflexota bacterium]